MATQTNQMVNDAALANIKTSAREKESNILNLIDDKLDFPMKITVSGTVVSVSASTVQDLKSDGSGGTTNSIKREISPLSGTLISSAASTLDVSSGAVSGNFDGTVSPPSMTASYYVYMGLELRNDGKIYYQFGIPASSSGSATKPTFTPSALAIGYILLQDNGTGGSWHFSAPLESNISQFISSGGGGEGGVVTTDEPSTMNNLSLACSVGSSALTIALKGKNGNDPSVPNVVSVSMRNATITNGTYNLRNITSALSLTISSGSTLGHTSNVPFNIFVYLIDSDGAGTMKLAVSSVLFNEESLATTVAEGGSGGADTPLTLYSDAVYTNKPIRLIGKLVSTQATAGVWATVPNIYIQEITKNKLYAKYIQTVGQNIGNGAEPIVNFNSKDFDPLNCVVTGASWKFYAFEAGVYVVHSQLRYANGLNWTVANYLALRCFKGGIAGDIGLTEIHASIVPATNGLSVRITTLVELEKYQYIDIRTFHAETSARATINGVSGLSYISIYKVG